MPKRKLTMRKRRSSACRTSWQPWIKNASSALQQVSERWTKLVDAASEIPLTPQLKDVYLALFGVIWLPFYVLKAGNKVVELAAYQTGDNPSEAARK